jgi:DNA-binding transcriptional LysR family regulator
MPSAGQRSVPLLDIDVLHSFVTIVEAGSFSRAAPRLFRTPSALSMQVKRLEQTLGETLLVREARRVMPTPEGELLLSYARRLLKLNEEAVSRFLSPSLEGTVRVGTPDDVGTRILPHALAQLARSHPAVQVEVVTGRSADLLARQGRDALDLVLVTVGELDTPPDPGEIVHSEPLVWAGLRGGVAFQRSPLPLAVARHGCAWRAMALAALDRAGMDYRVAYMSEHCAAQEAVLLADLAVAPFPASLISSPLQELDRDAGFPPLGEYQIALVRSDGLGPAGEVMAGHIAEAFHELRH